MESFDLNAAFAEKLIESLALDAFPLIAFTGGGGKTSLMFSIARALSKKGRAVLTTTTKIFPPSEAESDGCFVGPMECTLKKIAAAPVRGVITIAEATKGDKLVGYAPDEIDRISNAGVADWLLVEADGARRKPLKAYAEWEPPVPKDTRCQLVVIGADAFAQPIDEKSVCRFDRFSAATGLTEGAYLTPEKAAELLSNESEYLKNAPPGAYRVLFLNKAELLDEETRAHIVKILGATLKGYDRLIAASVRTGALYADVALKRG